jgi:hypothetical protein
MRTMVAELALELNVRYGAGVIRGVRLTRTLEKG